MADATRSHIDAYDAAPTFAAALRHLRDLTTCEPPVGVGSFDLLYASEREVVVWYSPAREQHHAGEVTVSCERLEMAWTTLIAGEMLDEAALETYGGSVAGGRWLLALLAQLPGVIVHEEPLRILWDRDAAQLARYFFQPLPISLLHRSGTESASNAQ